MRHNIGHSTGQAGHNSKFNIFNFQKFRKDFIFYLHVCVRLEGTQFFHYDGLQPKMSMSVYRTGVYIPFLKQIFAIKIHN